jgi:uncharacterized OB-fold protein
MCPDCGCTDWSPRPSSGRGTVLSWIVSRHPSAADDQPRVVALIELTEGARLVSNLREIDLTTVRNDMEVELFFADLDGVRLPQFRPAQLPRAEFPRAKFPRAQFPPAERD